MVALARAVGEPTLVVPGRRDVPAPPLQLRARVRLSQPLTSPSAPREHLSWRAAAGPLSTRRADRVVRGPPFLSTLRRAGARVGGQQLKQQFS